MAGPRGKGGVAPIPPLHHHEMYTVSCRWLVKEPRSSPGNRVRGAPSVSGCHCSFWDGRARSVRRQRRAGLPVIEIGACRIHGVGVVDRYGLGHLVGGQ